MDASQTTPLLVGLVLALVGILALVVLRRVPAKTAQSAEALLRGRPFAHALAIFAVLVGLVLVVARLA